MSIQFSEQPVKQIVAIAMTTDLHPPLYNLWLHASRALFGVDIWWYRFWSGLAYAVSAVLLYGVAKKLTAGKEQLYSAMYFLLSPFALYYASESRSYSFVVLVALIQYLFFERLVRAKNRNAFIGYTISSIVGCYLFYPILFSLVAQFVYVMAKHRREWQRFMWSWLILFVAYLPWLILVVFHRLNEAPGHFLAVPWWQIPAIIFVGFSGGRVAITDINHTHQYWPTIMISAINFLNLGALVWQVKKQGVNEALQRLVFLLGIPIALCLLVSVLRFSIFDPRYYAQLFPLYIILLMQGSAAWFTFQPRLARTFALLLIGANIFFLGQYAGNPWYGREPWKLVVQALERELQPGDVEVYIGVRQPPPTYTLYQTKDVPIISTYPDTLTNWEDYATIETHLTSSTAQAKRVWFSGFLEWQKDPNHRIRQMIEKDFRYVKTVGFFKVEYYLYERKN